jgi:hypothetical protein
MFSCQVSKNCGPAKEEEEALEKKGMFRSAPNVPKHFFATKFTF